MKAILFSICLLIFCAQNTYSLNITTTDTIVHLYSNGLISVKIHPWNEGRRSIHLYNRFGEETYQLEEVRLSFQVSHTLVFRENGSVRVIHSSLNPGASMNWYKTTTTFAVDNTPEWKKDETLPLQSLETPVNYYWKTEEKQWIKQEIIRCFAPMNVE